MVNASLSKTVLMPHNLTGTNIYLDEVGNAYRRTGCRLIYGVDNLFQGTVDADIVHLHWPEAFYRWVGWGPVEYRAKRFLQSIDVYKKQGAKIVWTIHNLSPHDHVRKGLDFDVYQEVANRADVFVHHCPQSIELLKNTYKITDQTSHIVQPHGHYLSYPSGVTQTEARHRLKIPEEAFVYLHFGQIRSYKGLDTLFAAFRKVHHPNKWLLVAGYYQGISGYGAWYDRLLMTWNQYAAPRMTLHLKSIPTDDIQTFFAASDCLVLSHSRGLNSGVAILGMTKGKLIVGPDLGCMEWVLNAGKNILYQKDSLAGLVEAMEQAPTQDLKKVKQINCEVAAGWSWDSMVHEILTTIMPN